MHAQHFNRKAPRPFTVPLLPHLKTSTSYLLTASALILLSPLLCIIGTGLLINKTFTRLKSHESPATKEKKWRQWRGRHEQSIKRTNPREVKLRRNGEDLTIGRKYDPIPTTTVPEIVSSEDGNAVIDHVILPMQEVRVGERGFTSAQENSIFFKLPYEIRKQIYTHCLSGSVFHIRWLEAYRKITHTRCTADPEGCKRAWCQGDEKQPSMRDKVVEMRVLDLVMCCRRIYSETIEMLYVENTFDFDSLAQVLRFSVTVLPERMGLVRKVQWRTPYRGLSTLTPWLDCRAPNPCSCIQCWPRDHHYIRPFFVDYES